MTRLHPRINLLMYVKRNTLARETTTIVSISSTTRLPNATEFPSVFTQASMGLRGRRVYMT